MPNSDSDSNTCNKPASVPESSNDDEPQNSDIESNFGEYLTSQYELLERTLSSLQLRDLRTAALVCKTWKETTNRIINKRVKCNKFLWKVSSRSRSQHDTRLLKYPIQMLLAFGSYAKRTLLKDEFCELSHCFMGSSRPQTFDGERFIYYVSSGLGPISVPFQNPGNIFKCLQRENAVISFPYRKNEFTVKAYYDFCELESQLHENLKGILMFTKEVNYDQLLEFYTRTIGEQKQHVALGGGVFDGIHSYCEQKPFNSIPYLCILFCGEIECYSDILTSPEKCDIEPFMRNMRNKLGCINSDTQQRIAFVIRCVGRDYRKFEKELFEKYFPETAAFMMLSYGEYGFRADSRLSADDRTKKRKRDLHIEYSYSTIYFIITVNTLSR